ncbi:MAG: SUMF1/EgtB/PvdO family nonheme iron enzyme, partial [Armatimonadetes bacterium]|nr:SUMF1/EgtB/PvdO family nonheme iron enzyme [Armatimonadota bacterium]
MKASGQPKPVYWEDAKFNDPKQPVVGVSWDDAQAYCK